MSINQTEHLGLHQWESGDPFLRTEFNENFQALERAVLDRTKVTAGSYVGNGDVLEIDLGFRPTAVIWSKGTYTSVVLQGADVNKIVLTETGFQVTYRSSASIGVNKAGETYYYLAF